MSNNLVSTSTLILALYLHHIQAVPATSEKSVHSEPGLLNVADPTPVLPQDFDWLFSLFDEKTFNNAYAYDTHAFSLPLDFGLTAPC